MPADEAGPLASGAVTDWRAGAGDLDPRTPVLAGVGQASERLGQPGYRRRSPADLAADQSAYITGQIRAVNGGLDM